MTGWAHLRQFRRADAQLPAAEAFSITPKRDYDPAVDNVAICPLGVAAFFICDRGVTAFC